MIDGLKHAHRELLHWWRWRRTPVPGIARAFTRVHGTAVLDGPFAGLRFPRAAVGRSEMLVAQLLGTYEQELHPALEAAIARALATVVDVGASDGYYAVGLARRLPQARVLAYEMEPMAARICARTAQENGVEDRVEVRGECTVAGLAALAPAAPVLVICDAEGAEARLIDPEAAPWLRRAHLIVELHEFAAPGIRERLPARFAATHDVELVDSRRRWVSESPTLLETPGLSYIDRELAISEFRHSPLSWAVMVPGTGD